MYSKDFDASTCPICAETYCNPRRRPLSLTKCGHSLCEICFAQMERQSKNSDVEFLCPICRAAITNLKPPVNFQLMNLVEEAAKKIHGSIHTTAADEKSEKILKDTVYFRNFPTDIGVEEIYSLFDSVANVKLEITGPSIRLFRFNEVSRGMGTVVFTSDQEAMKAITVLNHKMYPGTNSKMFLKYAKELPPRQKSVYTHATAKIPDLPKKNLLQNDGIYTTTLSKPSQLVTAPTTNATYAGEVGQIDASLTSLVTLSTTKPSISTTTSVGIRPSDVVRPIMRTTEARHRLLMTTDDDVELESNLVEAITSELQELTIVPGSTFKERKLQNSEKSPSETGRSDSNRKKLKVKGKMKKSRRRRTIKRERQRERQWRREDDCPETVELPVQRDITSSSPKTVITPSAVFRNSPSYPQHLSTEPGRTYIDYIKHPIPSTNGHLPYLSSTMQVYDASSGRVMGVVHIYRRLFPHLES